MSASSKVYKPESNWHRLVHLLALNGGTLYLAQMYKPKRRSDGTLYSIDHFIETNGMPKLTEYKLLASQSMRYEQQAMHMGWVTIQRWNNRTWVTLLPKGRSVLKAFRDGKNWDIAKQSDDCCLIKLVERKYK